MDSRIILFSGSSSTISLTFFLSENDNQYGLDATGISSVSLIEISVALVLPTSFNFIAK